MGEFAEQRVRLAEIDRELVRLQAQHDVAMSAFKFDQVNALHRRLAALEEERQALAAALPGPVVPPEPPSGVVPMLARPRRLRPRR